MSRVHRVILFDGPFDGEPVNVVEGTQIIDLPFLEDRESECRHGEPHWFGQVRIARYVCTLWRGKRNGCPVIEKRYRWAPM